MQESFKCFNVNFRLLQTIYVHLLVCYLNKLQNARCNDKDRLNLLEDSNVSEIVTTSIFRLEDRDERSVSYFINYCKFLSVCRALIPKKR